MYTQRWSEFEVQSLAYGILRKHLYPDFLVRGEYNFPGCRVDIAIFRAYKDKDPELLLVIEVKKSAKSTTISQGARYSTFLNVPCIYVRGVDDAYKIMEHVHPYLFSEE